ASAAASVIASPVGATSPAAAAAILGTAQQPPLDVTARVASRWASREDPRGALEWAQSLRDPEAQSSGIAAAAGAWAASDLPAAQAWALTLPSGDSRDDALAAILRQGIVSHGSIERRMLSGFSSGAARDGALEAAIPAFRRLADSAPDRARA